MMRSKVYMRIIEFHEAGRAWNLTTLEDSFRNDPYFIKYRDFFDELLPWTGELVIHNAKIIKECSDERKLIAATALSSLLCGVGASAGVIDLGGLDVDPTLGLTVITFENTDPSAVSSLTFDFTYISVAPSWTAITGNS